MPIKFLLLGGGGVLGFFRRGGGSANSIFMGVGILPNLSTDGGYRQPWGMSKSPKRRRTTKKKVSKWSILSRGQKPPLFLRGGFCFGVFAYFFLP